MLIKLNEDNIKWADMVKAHCQDWTAQDRCNFDTFVQAIARHVRDAGGTLEVIVNDIRQAGLSFRGAAGLDFVWVRINRNDFNAVSTESLRKKGLRTLEQTVYASERGWLDLARLVMEAHDFSVTSSKRKLKSEVTGNCDSLFASSPQSTGTVHPKAVAKKQRFDVERHASDIVKELVALAASRNSNGFGIESMSSLSACKSLTAAQMKTVLDMLCGSGQLVKDEGTYYLAAPSSEPVCCDTQEANGDTPPERVSTTISRPVRDSALVRDLKVKYGYRCQVCGEALKLPTCLYAEVHHLKPLGAPHHGSDRHENMIVVCPNHHALLDYGAVTLAKVDLKHQFHCISDKAIEYHNRTVCRQ